LPDRKESYPVEKTTTRERKESEKLYPIYKDLLDRMEKMKFIEIV
jgi:hypothetical protein